MRTRLLLAWLLLIACVLAAAGTERLSAAPPHGAIRSAESVKETTTTTGTGAFNLAGAVTGFQTFVSGVGDGAIVPYFVRLRGGSEWEYGIGTVTAGTPDTLARTTVLRGSNGTSAVNFSAGVKDIAIGAHPAYAEVHVAASAPTVDDDNNGPSGTFLPGSRWLDSSTDVLYILFDDTNGAAIWRPVGGAKGNIGAGETELTISSGAITITGNVHRVDGEGAAHDILTTINGGTPGALVFLRAESGARDIDVPDEAGNIEINGGVGALRLTVDHYTPFLYDATTTTWYHVASGFARSPQPNLLLNGDFGLWYRRATSAAAVTDDAYFAPKWYALVQGSGPTAAQTTGIARSGGTSACKLVAGGTTNRFGVAQIVEASSTHEMRGREITFQCDVRPTLNAGSGTRDLRMALLEWTGTADAVTSEVVADWTSGTYTTGNFFASTTLALVGTTQAAVTHNTFATLTLNGYVSNSANNLIFFVWHEDAPAHAADFIEVTEAGVYAGWTPQEWHIRPNERQLCERFCYRFEPSNFVGEYFVDAHRRGTTFIEGYTTFPTMRTTPAFIHPIATWETTTTGTDEVNFFNSEANAFATITGALTFAAGVIGPNSIAFRATAGTSFSGSSGDVGRFAIGDALTYLILDAEL